MSRYYLERLPHSVVFATSLNDLYNNHRVNFDGVNVGKGQTRHTSLDWFLSPTERPSIDKAPLKEHYIDVPGANGGLDLTEALTGFPLYDYIEGSFEFNILNDRKIPILNSESELINERDLSWEILNRDIRTFLNGRERYMMLEDDPSWYYKGRFTVEKYDSSNVSNSKIKINYKVYPFKKLSSYIYNERPENSFFDALSVDNEETSEILASFRNKTDINMYYGDTIQYNGSIAGKIPCGDEPVSPSFIFDSPINGYDIVIVISAFDGQKTRNVTTVKGEQTVTVRGVVLTNNRHKGTLYSDCWFNIVVYGFDDFDSAASYEKDAMVTYTNAQNKNFILKAKNDIEAGEFDISDWDIVTDALSIAEYSTLKSYAYKSLCYRIEDNDIVIYRCTAGPTTPGEFNPTYWSSSVSDVKVSDYFKPVVMSIRYDIGVM